MISALGSHRFNPQTGLWELVSLDNAAGVEMSLLAVAEVGGLGADGPATALPEPVTLPPSDDGVIAPVEPVVPVSPPLVIERPDGLTIIGGPIHSLLEGANGNDLVIAGASAANPENWVVRVQVWLDPKGSWFFGSPSTQQGMHGSLDADRYNANGSLGDTLNGGLGQDTLIGNDLSNDLNGGAGADVMIGGGGEDIYWVDNAGDLVIEYDHGGRDVVYSSVSYTVSAHVEKLVLALGAGDINGTGNELNNILIGNEGSNVLSGGAGNDWLHGGNGDTFIGGEGRDTFLLSYDDFINYPAGGANAIIADFQVGVDKIGYRYEHRLTSIEDAFFYGDAFDVDHIVGSPSMRQDGADTIVTWGQGEIRLIGVDMRLLGEQDFFVDVTYPVYFY